MSLIVLKKRCLYAEGTRYPCKPISTIKWEAQSPCKEMRAIELCPQKGLAMTGDIKQTQLIHLSPSGEKLSLRKPLQREENSPYDASSPMSSNKKNMSEYRVGYAIV